MLTVVLVACFAVCMLLWAISLHGSGSSGVPVYTPWLGWLSVLLLALIVFLARPVPF